ncbi:hypothetical protein SAMN05421686_103208 [Thalassolituus maritimus]|uniref:Uncharacterized protein n=1 Tax=Thalassolituus maritimus TaxID=484498 RepID=A0A1N7L0U6_9GAMM|nr:hypothetical protein SAMN05421686_103208 [Thalassolituus maritimus]
MDFPGETLLIKMWETLAEKGIGSLLAPWHEKRMGEARSQVRKQEMLVIAEAEREAEAIRSGERGVLANSDVQLLEGPRRCHSVAGRKEPTIDLSIYRS